MKLILQAAWGFLSFLLALWISWQALSQVNFLYATWYEHAGIKEHIEHYAPQNKNREGFETTTDEQRIALFAGIVSAINAQGAGLDGLTYAYQGTTINLLTTDETVHLQDVANLMDALDKAALFILLIWVVLTLKLYFARPSPTPAFPTLKQSGLQIVGVLILATLILSMVGAKAAFYQFHIWVFPDNHVWFFYYQDSLMSTMMKAPDLFAYIGLTLVALAVFIFGVGVKAVQFRP